MNKFIKSTLPLVLVFILSCNSTSTPSDTNDENTATIDVGNVSNNFVGQWKYYSAYPKDQKDDGSMNGLICNLEKLENTNESFVCHLFTGNDLILSIKDANTLAGQNAGITLKYDENSGHLIMLTHGNSGTEWLKMK